MFYRYVIACLTLVSGLAAAQEVVVSTADGRELVGTVVSEPGAATLDLVVETAGIRGRLHIPVSDVVAVRPHHDPERAELDGLLSAAEAAEQAADPAALWELAQRVAMHDRMEYRGLARRVLALDADHVAARAALGQRRYQGEWMTEPEIRRAQGLVYHEGAWHTPAAYTAIIEAEATLIAARADERESRALARRLRAAARRDYTTPAAYNFVATGYGYRASCFGGSGSVVVQGGGLLQLPGGTTTVVSWGSR